MSRRTSGCSINSSSVHNSGHSLQKVTNSLVDVKGKILKTVNWLDKGGLRAPPLPISLLLANRAYQSHAVPNMRLLLSDLMVQKNKRENVPPPTQRLILWDWLMSQLRNGASNCVAGWDAQLKARLHIIQVIAGRNSLVDVKGKAWTILNTVNGFDQFHTKKVFILLLDKSILSSQYIWKEGTYTVGRLIK